MITVSWTCITSHIVEKNKRIDHPEIRNYPRNSNLISKKSTKVRQDRRTSRLQNSPPSVEVRLVRLVLPCWSELCWTCPTPWGPTATLGKAWWAPSHEWSYGTPISMALQLGNWGYKPHYVELFHPTYNWWRVTLCQNFPQTPKRRRWFSGFPHCPSAPCGGWGGGTPGRSCLGDSHPYS